MEIRLVKDFLINQFHKDINKTVKRELVLKNVKGKATTIIGPRRAGKTTLMWQEILNLERQETVYLDFEDVALKRISAVDCLKVVTELFTEVSGSKVKNIFLDEIQNLDDWQSLVRTLLDRGYNVYASGSSSRLLTREIATQLRGRSFSFLLLPFSFSEFLAATGNIQLDFNLLEDMGMLKNLLSTYVDSGGYPEIILIKGEKDILLSEYRELIFFKDFVERQKIKSIEVARFIFNFVTQCFASEISVRKIVNELGSRGMQFGKNTVYEYIEKLQDTMIFFFIERYSTKIALRSGWPKKVYLADNGLAWRLPYDKGRLIENLVFLQLKRKQTSEAANQIYYFRDERDREVDFVLKRGEKIEELIQVTYASSENDIKNREIGSLLEAGNKLNCNNLTIITWDLEDTKSYSLQEVKFVPLWKWLLVAK